jgi:hypothetical protein
MKLSTLQKEYKQKLKKLSKKELICMAMADLDTTMHLIKKIEILEKQYQQSE